MRIVLLVLFGLTWGACDQCNAKDSRPVLGSRSVDELDRRSASARKRTARRWVTSGPLKTHVLPIPHNHSAVHVDLARFKRTDAYRRLGGNLSSSLGKRTGLTARTSKEMALCGFDFARDVRTLTMGLEGPDGSASDILVLRTSTNVRPMLSCYAEALRDRFGVERIRLGLLHGLALYEKRELQSEILVLGQNRLVWMGANSRTAVRDVLVGRQRSLDTFSLYRSVRQKWRVPPMLMWSMPDVRGDEKSLPALKDVVAMSVGFETQQRKLHAYGLFKFNHEIAAVAALEGLPQLVEWLNRKYPTFAPVLKRIRVLRYDKDPKVVSVFLNMPYAEFIPIFDQSENPRP